jgi:glutathione peroxidase
MARAACRAALVTPLTPTLAMFILPVIAPVLARFFTKGYARFMNPFTQPIAVKKIALKIAFLGASLLLLASAQAANLCAGAASYSVQPLIGGKAFDLCQAPAKAVLLVNTASRCGFTPQYEGLEKLHQQYKTKGLMVVALPANDFGQQESGGNKQIADFCKINYGVSFTVGEKLTTPIGKDPLYQKLIAASGKAPSWNFHKYLITPDGKVQSFESAVEPQSAALTKAVEAALVK